jgi:hypothetical protein
MQTTLRLLKDAERYLIVHGWSKTEYEDSEGRCCATGVIYKVDYGNAFPVEGQDASSSFVARAILMKAIEDLFPSRFTGTIASFNTHPDTAYADVLLVFHHAIEICKLGVTDGFEDRDDGS